MIAHRVLKFRLVGHLVYFEIVVWIVQFLVQNTITVRRLTGAGE